jgi:hypothetical protein
MRRLARVILTVTTGLTTLVGTAAPAAAASTTSCTDGMRELHTACLDSKVDVFSRKEVLIEVTVSLSTEFGSYGTGVCNLTVDKLSGRRWKVAKRLGNLEQERYGSDQSPSNQFSGTRRLTNLGRGTFRNRAYCYLSGGWTGGEGTIAGPAFKIR